MYSECILNMYLFQKKEPQHTPNINSINIRCILGAR